MSGLFPPIPISGLLRRSFPVVLTIASFTLSSCRNQVAEKKEQAVSVPVISVAVGAASDPYLYPGTVEGDRKVTLSTKVMGQILSLPFAEGARVHEGQVVARIKSGDLSAKRAQISANRDEAAAALKNVETNYHRITTLFEHRSATRKELDDITAAYAMAQAKVREVDEMDKELADVLRYADLVSPIDGAVVGKFTEEGNMASPGMPIIAIEDTRRLKVAITIPESEISLVRIHTPVQVEVDAAKSASLIDGEVSEINGGSNAGSHDFNVKILLRSVNDPGIRPGMFATVHIPGPAGRAIAIPESLLVHRGGLDGVYVISPAGEASLRLVRTGHHFDGDRVEILSGLRPGESVVAARMGLVHDGMIVEAGR